MSKRPPLSPDPADESPDIEAEALSKTRLKKLMTELQAMGEELAELSPDKLSTIEMPQRLLEAVLELKRTRSHEGRRRQLQYVGKMMRLADAEPIREALAAFKIGHAKDSLDLHRAERWRAELMADDEALTRWVNEHPGSDIQQLRNLVRAARKDAAAAPEQRNGRGFRELYQFVKQGLSAAQRADQEASDGD